MIAWMSIRFTAAVVAAFAFLCACIPGGAQTLTPLHVVTTPTDTGAQVYYAIDEGFFKKAGFDVTVDAINSGAAIANAVTGGTYDIGQTSVAALAIAHDRGIPYVVIAPGAAYTSKTPTSELLVSATSSIRTASDLTGKTIAVVGLKGLTQLAVQAWLEQNHVPSSGVKFIELTFNEMPAALAANRIDAAFVAEPALDRARQGGARIIGHPYDAVASNFLVGAWFTTRDYAQRNADVIRRFRSGLETAAVYANAHPKEMAQYIAPFTGIDEAKLRQWTRAQVATTPIVPADIQPVIDVAAKYRFIDKPFPASEIIFAG